MLRLSLAALLLCTSAIAEQVVIAHRGASGYLPEETLPAYAYAYAAGADYLEPDLILTKDKIFICMHDTQLETTTNVKDVFPDRKADDGHWYAKDFTLAELKTLTAHERTGNRFPREAQGFQIATFEELIQLVQGLNKTTGRNVGIYPELKDPSWHAKNGFEMEGAFLEIMTKYGYTGKDAKCFVQCFEPEPLKKMREMKSELPQIFLMDAGTANKLTEGDLTDIAKFATGIGPDLRAIERDPALVERVHTAGLLIHPYTLRKDMMLPKYKTFEDAVKTYYDDYKVDGFFTDFPDYAAAHLRAKKGK